jgi:hypothetical protein
VWWILNTLPRVRNWTKYRDLLLDSSIMPAFSFSIPDICIAIHILFLSSPCSLPYLALPFLFLILLHPLRPFFFVIKHFCRNLSYFGK